MFKYAATAEKLRRTALKYGIILDK